MRPLNIQIIRAFIAADVDIGIVVVDVGIVVVDDIGIVVVYSCGGIVVVYIVMVLLL